MDSGETIASGATISLVGVLAAAVPVFDVYDDAFASKPLLTTLVEDNPGDVRLTEKAFEEVKLANNLHVTTDGVEAMTFLRSEGEFADAPRPDIVLLDLNLPKKDGTEVLADVKADDDLKEIPVVVLTSSEAEEDVIETYNNHANAYLTKPVDFEGFTEIVKKIEGFWFTLVKFPPDDA